MEKIRIEGSVVSLFFVTLFIVFLQTLLFIPVFGESLLNLQVTSGALFLFPTNLELVLIYFILPFLYCIFASFIFHPKRIVSPLNVQIGTIAVVCLMIIYRATSTLPQTSTVIQNLIVSIFFTAMIAVGIGIFQLFIVRWVIGLNFDSVDRESFSINSQPKEVMKILGDSFLEVWEFSRKKDNPTAKTPIWVLRCRDPYGNTIILTIGNTTNKDECILATVAYSSSLYGILKSDTATKTRKSIIRDIKGRLKESDAKLTLKPLDNISDPISTKAYTHALSVTLSKVELTKEFFKSIPRYYLYTICVTIVALVAINIAFGLKLLDFGTFLSVFIVILVALLIELGVSLREELSRQKIEELD